MTTPELFEFDGRQVTAKALASEYTAYSEKWIRAALREGCTCTADFAQRHAEALARQKAHRQKTAGEFHFGRARG